MKPLIVFNLRPGIEAYREAFEPPVGHQVIWEDSQITATIAYRPHTGWVIVGPISASI